MKKILILTAIIILTLFVSCRKCKELQFCPKTETGERYFANYKEGTSWVYVNKDGTKKDSVFVTDYTLSLEKNRTDGCIEWERHEMKIFSKYLFPKNLYCLYENPNCDRSYFVFGGISSMDSKIGTDTLFSVNATIKIKTLNSHMLPNNIQFEKTVEVQSVETTLWFAPYIGLIQYTTFDNSDTLYFQKIYKK